MTLKDKIEALQKHGEVVHIGRTFGVFSKGWLSFTDHCDVTSVMFTTGRDTNQPLISPAYTVDYLKTTGERKTKTWPGGLSGVWKSALSMWPVSNEAEAQKITEQMKTWIEQAYAYNCTPRRSVFSRLAGALTA